jgi:predicted AAA+ superfamily ATPase
MEVIDLMPLSQGEILGKQETFIDSVFSNQQLKTPKTALTRENLYKKVIIGGYPSVQNTNEETMEAWMRSYLNLILQRDIKDLANIEKLTELPNLLRILAHRASGLLNVAEISRECKMVAQTVHRYLALLETIFLINVQQSWHTNATLRFVKSPKLYLVDSRLLAYLVGMDQQRAAVDNQAMGNIIENFIVSELKKQITWSTTRPELYHFRTSGGEEVDIILENRSGSIVAIEIKASESVDPKDFKGLRYLQEKAGNKFIQGIVLYAGSQYVPFGDKLSALPIHTLWD